MLKDAIPILKRDWWSRAADEIKYQIVYVPMTQEGPDFRKWTQRYDLVIAERAQKLAIASQPRFIPEPPVEVVPVAAIVQSYAIETYATIIGSKPARGGWRRLILTAHKSA